jgi:hypothetical protein
VSGRYPAPGPGFSAQAIATIAGGTEKTLSLTINHAVAIDIEAAIKYVGFSQNFTIIRRKLRERAANLQNQ